MKTIWKFPLNIEDEIRLDMPEGWEPLHLALQNGRPTLWALVDPNAPLCRARFAWRGTGHDASGLIQKRHLGTVLLEQMGLVFHLFALPRNDAL